ncbi:ATP-binding protein, partial [Streptomyces sp. A012304]|uniref:sensor histidine kinase n=1 Tax=Streptomyces sp. A012304 TaxID=375446 RepID=UPI00222FC1EF
MSHLRAPTARADRREGGRHGRPVARTAPAPAETHIRPQLLRLAVLPPTAVALSACAAVLFIVRSTGVRASTTLWAVLAGAVTVTTVGILIAAVAADRAARSVTDRLTALRRSSARGEADLRSLVDTLRRGEVPAQRKARSGPPADADEFELLAADLAHAHDGAVTAVVQAAQLSSQAGSEQKLEVFVNLARRLQSLVHREISILDELENEIEDPDLLKGLFHVDHLATRIRRHAENLAVLGGAVSRRQWSNPVSMTEVLRSAIAEVEQYSRVRLVPPIDGELRGHAVADVIHLLAELVENATVFSAPHTQVLLRANLVTSGLAVEVEDRGLGLPVEEQSRMNALLADPDQVNVGRLLADGRIGLFVVSQLARRHGIRVRLQTNIYGGVQAVLVVPQALLGSTGLPVPRGEESGNDPNGQGRQRQTDQAAPAAGPAATGAAPAPSPARGTRGDGTRTSPARTPRDARPPITGRTVPAGRRPAPTDPRNHPSPTGLRNHPSPADPQAAPANRLSPAEPQAAAPANRPSPADPQAVPANPQAASPNRRAASSDRLSPSPDPQPALLNRHAVPADPQATLANPQAAPANPQAASPTRPSVASDPHPASAAERSAPSYSASAAERTAPPHPASPAERTVPPNRSAGSHPRPGATLGGGSPAVSAQVGSSTRRPGHDTPRVDSRNPAPLPVRGAHEHRPNPAEAVPGIRPGDRPRVEENAGLAPTPRVGAVRGTMGKPQLPRRRAQEHLVPQLRGGPAPRQDDDHVGHDPGLMAAFQRGVGLAETQLSLEADGADPTPYPSPLSAAPPVHAPASP